MWIQRRPGGSTRSTRGSSARSGARSAALARERRPNGLRGRLGMGATERLVGRRHNARDSRPVRFFRYLYGRTHQEGWRDWPDETPPTLPVARREKVAITPGSKTMAWEMRGKGNRLAEPDRRIDRAEGSETYAGRCPAVQGVPDHLSARRALRVRALLRPARGRVPTAGRRPGRAQAPHPSRPAHALALRRLPALDRPAAVGAAHRLDAARPRRPARRAAGDPRAVDQER